ncbi:ABC transporter permease [uncultured Hoeflea sp.]|uniref:ABC transporter permease n=1 Tax=uncultured Hoeflea sp. TaxID=538666 RepID=UPI0026230AFD|nr:ABC transporter permease [uncultured Hoeflea sp.]
MIFAITRRSFQALITLLILSLLAFTAVYAIGDPILLLIDAQASSLEQEALRTRLGLDQPMPVQYLYFLQNLMSGDFGRSFVSGEPALRLILERLPATLELAFVALLIATVVGVPLGMIAGLNAGSRFDRVVSVFSVLGFSVPSFWIGIILILVFSVQLGVLPSFGRGDTATLFGIASSLWTFDGWRHILLPATNLALFPMALLIRLARAGASEAVRLDFIKFARAKGVTTRRIIFVHLLKYISISLVTILGMQLGLLIAFAIVTESVFSWPGTGKLIIDAMNSLDRPVIVAYLLIVGCIFVIANTVTDLLYIVLDPRIRSGGGNDPR